MVELDGHQRGVWIPRVGHKQMNTLTMASGKKQWRDRANNGDQASHAQRNNGEGPERMATLPFNRGKEWRKRERITAGQGTGWGPSPSKEWRADRWVRDLRCLLMRFSLFCTTC